MEINTKMIFVLAGLVGTMYYWVNQDLQGMSRIVSMLMLTILAYWLGRLHGNKISAGRVKENRTFREDTGFLSSPPNF